MQIVFFVLGAVVVLSALLSYVTSHPVDLAVAVPETQVASVSQSGTPFVAEGMLVLDDTGGGTGVPFLVYEAEGRPIMTKQLVFGYEDCDVYARDLPCASGAPVEPPPLSGGERLRVEGRQVAERVYVSRIQVL